MAGDKLYSIIKFIELFRNSVPNAKEIFMKGNCTSFARILSIAFPGGQVLHNIDHAVYEYHGLCYDITGEVEKPKGALPIEEYGLEMILELTKNNY